MKAFVLIFVASSAVMGCAAHTPSPDIAAAPVAGEATAQAQKMDTRGYTSALVSENKYELKYSGPWLGSRDTLEGALLYRAALLARKQGSTWFRFLHMPGEGGPLSHPSRPSPSFGSAYGHWQPHWSYRTTEGWQPWHPEWGDRFWADRLSKGSVAQVEVHAMIELRPGAYTPSEQTDFGVLAVMRDLRPFR